MKKTLFNKIYLGKAVEITSRMIMNSTVETDQGIVDVSHPVTVLGFLIDVDDEFYYLGDYDDEIVQSIKKTDVAHIALIKQKTIVDDVLDKLPVPKNYN